VLVLPASTLEITERTKSAHDFFELTTEQIDVGAVVVGPVRDERDLTARSRRERDHVEARDARSVVMSDSSKTWRPKVGNPLA
jgi:hypothetical protein